MLGLTTAATLAGTQTAVAAGQPPARTCGILPGDGFYSYHGWRYRAREGYELNDVRCRHGEISFHHESAA
jgi:hypothetical protein